MFKIEFIHIFVNRTTNCKKWMWVGASYHCICFTLKNCFASMQHDSLDKICGNDNISFPTLINHSHIHTFGDCWQLTHFLKNFVYNIICNQSYVNYCVDPIHHHTIHPPTIWTTGVQEAQKKRKCKICCCSFENLLQKYTSFIWYMHT